jgi:hypothetical protein
MFDVLFYLCCRLCFRLSLIKRADIGQSSRPSRARLWVVWAARQVNPWTIAHIISFSLYLLVMPFMKCWILVCLSFRINSLVVGLHMGSIVFLSPVIIALVLSYYSYCKLSYVGLWSSILCDVSGHIVDKCRGLSKVVIQWGRWLPSWFVDASCLNQLRTSS